MRTISDMGRLEGANGHGSAAVWSSFHSGRQNLQGLAWVASPSMVCLPIAVKRTRQAERFWSSWLALGSREGPSVSLAMKILTTVLADWFWRADLNLSIEIPTTPCKFGESRRDLQMRLRMLAKSAGILT